MSAPANGQKASSKGEMPLFATLKTPNLSSGGIARLGDRHQGRFEHHP